MLRWLCLVEKDIKIQLLSRSSCSRSQQPSPSATIIVCSARAVGESGKKVREERRGEEERTVFNYTSASILTMKVSVAEGLDWLLTRTLEVPARSWEASQSFTNRLGSGTELNCRWCPLFDQPLSAWKASRLIEAMGFHRRLIRQQIEMGTSHSYYISVSLFSLLFWLLLMCRCLMLSVDFFCFFFDTGYCFGLMLLTWLAGWALTVNDQTCWLFVGFLSVFPFFFCRQRTEWGGGGWGGEGVKGEGGRHLLTCQWFWLISRSRPLQPK